MVFSNNNSSDYGSGNTSSDSVMSLGGNERWSSYQPRMMTYQPQRKASSYTDLVMGRCTLEDVMREFRMNGSDCPYTPDEDASYSHRADELTGMGASGAYLRQKSWPEPERTPIVKLPAPPTQWLPAASLEFTSTPDFRPAARVEVPSPPPASTTESITEDQLRVLLSLPSGVLAALLRQLETHEKPRKRHPDECRFCKNNGERESFYRGHALKGADGRVACPVLRAFVCKRCGASGDRAHTIKYCPLSTNEERIKSAAMMRSVRMASGRRRAAPAPAPLAPLWAALEQKLTL